MPLRITVPFGYQTALSGINDKSIHEVVWYARSFELPEESKKFTVRVENGRVRLYGVEFSKSRPGVLYSNLGVNGANITLLSHAFNNAHWAAQLHHYRPDLVVLAYGTNESGFPKFVDSTWGGELKAAVKRLQPAL